MILNKPLVRTITGSFTVQRNLVLLVGILLSAAIFVPLSVMAIMTVQPGAIVPFPLRSFSLDSYDTVFGAAITYRLLLNTVMYSAGSITVGIVLASILAWFIGRTDLPLRNVMFSLVYASFGIPGLIIGLGWAIAAAPRSGVLNVLVRDLFGSSALSGPLDVYSWPGLILVTGFGIAPSMFVLLSTLFERMDPSLEQASLASGANRITTIRKVTFPLMRPGLMTVLVYFSTTLIQSFEIPLALGLPARIPVLSTRIYVLSQPELGSVNYSVASTFGIIALVTGLMLMSLYFYYTRAARRYQVITGKGYRPERIPLKRWKYPALGLVLGIILLKIAVPMGALAIEALYPLGVYPWENFGAASFDPFLMVFRNSKVLQSLFNTGLLVVTASTAGILLATMVAWLSQRSRVGGAKFLEHLAFLPLPIPGVVMALGLLLVAVRTPLWGSVWLIAIAHVINFQPFGVRMISAAIMQIGNELEEAGATSGVSPLKNFWRIVVPLVFPAIRNGWMWMLAHSARDFTYPLMFRSGQNLVIATLIWELWQDPSRSGDAAALSLLLVLALWIIAFSVRRSASSAV